jgi:CRP-like cAMP-binding protein
MIATGRVALYLESSKDREMVIGREFGHYRGQKFKEPLEKLNGLGKNIFTLPTGAGFGEFAILSTTQKLRSCAAVSIDDKCFLFIMHGETYDKVLRQHHYRQRTLSIACKLLQELPLFQKFTFSKISQVAYTMRSQLYSVKTKIVSAGDPVKCIYVVGSG